MTVQTVGNLRIFEGKEVTEGFNGQRRFHRGGET